MSASPTCLVHCAVHAVRCNQSGADELITKVEGGADKTKQGGVPTGTCAADLQVDLQVDMQIYLQAYIQADIQIYI